MRVLALAGVASLCMRAIVARGVATVMGHDDDVIPPSSSLSLAVSFEFPDLSLATKDKGCARCGT